VPVARSLIGQGACLLVDTVNVHLTPCSRLTGSFGAAAGGKAKKKHLLQQWY
jgi:hypothetical protein